MRDFAGTNREAVDFETVVAQLMAATALPRNACAALLRDELELSLGPWRVLAHRLLTDVLMGCCLIVGRAEEQSWLGPGPMRPLGENPRTVRDRMSDKEPPRG